MPNEKRVKANYVSGKLDVEMAAPVLAPYSDTVLADTPLLYLKAEDAAGSTALADSSGNARTVAQAAGAATYQAPGIRDTKAVTLDADDRFDRTDVTGLTPTHITLELWIKTTAASGQMMIRDSQAAGGRAFQFRLNAGKPELIVFTGGINAGIVSSVAVNDDAFHHVVGTFDAAVMRVYVDGVERASAANTGNLDAGGTERLCIGGAHNVTGQTLSGTLDEMAIYGVALSPAQITAHYDAGAAPVPTSTMSSPGLAKLPVIDTTNHAALILTDASTGNHEIVHAISHAAGAVTASVRRNREGSTARTWPIGAAWQHGPTSLDYPSVIEDQQWTNLALVNGWVAYGPPWAVPGFRKHLNGLVEVRGLMKSGTTTAGTVIATLPVGYRPLSSRLFGVRSDVGSARMDVQADGAIVAGAGVSAPFTALDGISFFAEQ